MTERLFPGIIDSADQRRQYFEALGKFVNAFARAEAFTHFVFPTFSKLPPTMAMAVKGGMRLSDLMPIIRRVMEINDFEDEARTEVDTLFTQLNEISIFRDRILHRGAEMLPDGTFESHNHATMKAIENLEIVKFTLEDIQGATSDLSRIALRIAMFMSKDDDLDEAVMQYLYAPWRYKPVTLEKPNQPRPTRRPARPRPRRPSRGK
jgi:hypothetical protein